MNISLMNINPSLTLPTKAKVREIMGVGMSNTGMRMEIAESEASSYWTCLPTQFYGDVDHWGEGGSVCAWTAPWICGKAFETPSGHVFAKVGLAMPDWDYGVGLPIEISNSYGIHEFKTNGRTKDPEISLVNVTDFQEELPGYEAGIFSEQFLHEKNMPSVVVDNTNRKSMACCFLLLIFLLLTVYASGRYYFGFSS
mmetsp:Transcript_40276/g.68693  ORF Transcript_40276/g.68693 Transcript_40276/m.68693 type:complete len:197 (-) Transcript_40276:270-860(-)